MATPPETDGGAFVELDEEIDGDEIGTRNYRFIKIGDSVPISSEFDPQSLPAQPLAVSERLRLLFVAHLQGFYVSRTKDVMEAAEEIKEKQNGLSLKDLSLVDVPIGKVSILALSSDDSLLAASVDSHIHFFAISALLHKDQMPSYSVSLDDSSCIKDVRWAKKVARAYLIHSANGKLYQGSGQGPLACVMESVDSVDWSVKGNFVAVAKKKTVIILSSEFKEKLRFLLSFQSVVGDSDVHQVIKVDSIRWIRPDCIVIGCFQLNDDGEEENYIVQVITSRGGRLTDESSKPTVSSFNNVFMDFCSDVVPTKNGPHLFLSYLDRYGVAFIANRNLSLNVGLFRWSSDSVRNEVAMVEILDDAWTLYIDSQDNDEDNVIVGLSVDKVSQNENVRFTLGDVETVVSPCCVIICLTIDGKISVFHFASAAGALEDDVSAEEDDASQVLVKHELPLISQTFSTPESHKFSRSEVEKTGAISTITNDVSPSINVDIKSREQTTTENMGQKPLVYSRAAQVDEPEKALLLNQDSNEKNQSLNEVNHSTGFFSGKVVGDSSCQPVTKDPPSGFNVETLRKEPPASSPSLRSSERVDASKTSDGRFSLLPSTSFGMTASTAQGPEPAVTSTSLGPTVLIAQEPKPAVTSTSFGPTASTAQGPKPAVTSAPFGLTSIAQEPKPAVTSAPFGLTSSIAQEPKPAVTSAPFGLTSSTAQEPKLAVTSAPFGLTSSIAQEPKPAVNSAPFGLTSSTAQEPKPAVTSAPFGLTSSTAQEPKPAVTSASFGLTSSTAQEPKLAVTSAPFGLTSSIAQEPKPAVTSAPFGLTSSTAQEPKLAVTSAPFVLTSSIAQEPKPAVTSAPFGLTSPTAQEPKLAVTCTSFGPTASTAQGPKPAVTSTSFGPTASIAQGPKPAVTSAPFGLTASTAQGPKPAVTSTHFGLTSSTAQWPKPAVTNTSFGPSASTAQGHRQSLSTYPNSQASLGATVASGKPFQSEFRKESNLSSSSTDAPKQFGTVEEMAKKLDILLVDIEGKGGFIDASITSQTKSVMELEDGIGTLSGRCRTWKGLMNEQLRELQLLLDKTVQALVRKVYMEGVFKQATDTRYWELWNRQKLSSELELKQRRILELNQELTNKLIELERHFNTLEFNKFGENGGIQRNRRVLQNGHSRQTQSLHSLHNTMQAQLAAAEQLSGCLSNQMSALRIESSEKQGVKKKLFESIGLSYTGDTERSPAGPRTSGTPLNKEHLITSSSIASKDHSRRNQASFTKSPETARRRRDSLDRSWTSFEPPKTTVKRVLKEDYDQGNANRSFLNIDKQYLSPQSQKKSEFAHSARSNMFRASLNSYKTRGTGETPEQYTKSPLTSVHRSTAGSLDNGNQVSSTKSHFALPPPSILETRTTQNSEYAAFKQTDEKTNSSLSFTGKNNSFAAGEPSFVHKQTDTSFHPLPSISTQLPEQSQLSPSVSTESSDHFKLGFAKSTTGYQKKNTSVGSETPLYDLKIPVNPAPAFSSTTNVSEKGSFTMNSEKPSRPNENSAASSIPPQSLFGSSLLFSSSNLSSSFASSVSKPSSSTPFSIPNFAPSSHESNASSISFPSSSITKPAESLTSLSHPMVDNTPAKISVDNTPSETIKDVVKIQASPSQPAFTISTHDLNLGPSTSSVSTELPTNLKLGSQFDYGGLSKSSSSVVSVSKTDVSSVAPSSEGIIGGLKNIISNSSHEEEMEEEAPETELSLGNLGGFGIGSTPNSTTPKPNPFGVTNLNNDAAFASSSNMMSTPSSGELFRPASFNFQSSQSPQPVQTTSVNFPGGFSSGNSGQPVSGFGQPAHIGAGQQALGSVLGSFGQSRQIGTGIPGNNAAPASAFGNGFSGVSPGGFSGGFAAAAPSAGGFAGLATGGGSFGSSGVAGGGFAAAANAGGGGFAAAASGVGGFAAPMIGGAPGGGFGVFGNQQGGGGGFSAFGGGSGVAKPPSELFTQMRK